MIVGSSRCLVAVGATQPHDKQLSVLSNQVIFVWSMAICCFDLRWRNYNLSRMSMATLSADDYIVHVQICQLKWKFINWMKRWMLQPLLTPVNYFGHFSILAKVISANPLHSAIVMVSSLNCKPLSSLEGGLTLLHLRLGIAPCFVNKGYIHIIINGNSILCWSACFWSNYHVALH